MGVNPFVLAMRQCLVDCAEIQIDAAHRLEGKSMEEAAIVFADMKEGLAAVEGRLITGALVAASDMSGQTEGEQ